MSRWNPTCEETITIRKILVDDKPARSRAKIYFLNPKSQAIRKVKVDGCAIVEGKRCDWLLISPDSTERFIELKGKKTKEAVEQLKEAVAKIGNTSQSVKKHAYVVSSRLPKASPERSEYLRKFRQIGTELHFRRSGDEVAL